MQENKNRKMLENLFNIQKTAFRLGKDPLNIDMINNFDETTRRLDTFDNKEYKKSIAPLLNASSVATDECDRLGKLILLTNERIDKRSNLIKEYNKATGRIIEDLEPLEGVDDIYAYKQRYNNIKKYLDATTKSKVLEEDVIKLKSQLKEKKLVREANKKNNKILEEKLEERFFDIYNDYLTINDINRFDIETKNKEVKMELRESLSSLNAFELAYNAIKNGHIDLEQLSKYDKDAYDFKANFYNTKVKEILVRILLLIITPTDCKYENMLLKRENIKDTVNELYLVKSKYKIYEENFFKDLIYFINEQCNELSRQAYIENEIIKLEEKINFKEEKLTDFKNNLEEYGVIKIMEEFKCKKNKEETKLHPKPNVDYVPLIVYKDNEVVSCCSLNDNMDIGAIRRKTDDVLKRVSDMLGINRVDKKIEAPVFKPIIIKSPIENQFEEHKNEVKSPDIFNDNVKNIFENDNIIKTDNDDIFFEMPTLPLNNFTNVSSRYNENDFPF